MRFTFRVIEFVDACLFVYGKSIYMCKYIYTNIYSSYEICRLPVYCLVGLRLLLFLSRIGGGWIWRNQNQILKFAESGFLTNKYLVCKQIDTEYKISRFLHKLHSKL